MQRFKDCTSSFFHSTPTQNAVVVAVWEVRRETTRPVISFAPRIHRNTLRVSSITDARFLISTHTELSAGRLHQSPPLFINWCTVFKAQRSTAGVRWTNYSDLSTKRLHTQLINKFGTSRFAQLHIV